MEILIIGSKGFIGSHLVRYFKTRAYQVWECDVLVDYVTTNYIQVDCTNANFQQVFENNSFDVCINCSGAASVPDSLNNPERDFFLNTVNVFDILNSIRRYNKACKFINLSSAAVYGNPIELPIKEQFEVNPISPYGKHKLMAEMLCEEFYSDFGLQTCSLRIFSAYGDGLKKQLLWDISQKMKKTSTLEMFGSGLETRDFIHVEDIAQVVELVLKSDKFKADVINVGNGQEVSIREIVELFIQKNKSWKGEVVFSGANRKGDPIHWAADISLIKLLGYKQSVKLEEGIKQYIQWVQDEN